MAEKKFRNLLQDSVTSVIAKNSQKQKIVIRKCVNSQSVI